MSLSDNCGLDNWLDEEPCELGELVSELAGEIWQYGLDKKSSTVNWEVCLVSSWPEQMSCISVIDLVDWIFWLDSLRNIVCEGLRVKPCSNLFEGWCRMVGRSIGVIIYIWIIYNSAAFRPSESSTFKLRAPKSLARIKVNKPRGASYFN